MKRKIPFLYVLTIFTLLFVININSASAEEKTGDYVIVDAKTGEEEVIDLSEERYEDIGEFISQPSLPSIMSAGNSLGLDTGIGTQSIIGSDDRWQVTNTGDYPYHTVARLTVTYQDGTSACGTGAMINPKLLATAGHVLINSNGSHPQSIHMQFGQNGSYVYYDTSSYSSYIYRTGYETDRPLEADYGFVVFGDNTVSSHTGYMGIVTSPSQSETLYTAGYPGDKGYYYMYAATGNIISMTDDLINHNMDTFPGQSGSPVYVLGSNNSLPYLVAMHSSGVNSYNVARRLEPALFHWLKDNGYIS